MLVSRGLAPLGPRKQTRAAPRPRVLTVRSSAGEGQGKEGTTGPAKRGRRSSKKVPADEPEAAAQPEPAVAPAFKVVAAGGVGGTGDAARPSASKPPPAASDLPSAAAAAASDAVAASSGVIEALARDAQDAANDAAAAASGVTDALARDAQDAASDAAAAASGVTETAARDARDAASDAAAAASGVTDALARDAQDAASDAAAAASGVTQAAASSARDAVEDARAAALGVSEALTADVQAAVDDATSSALGVTETLINSAASAASDLLSAVGAGVGTETATVRAPPQPASFGGGGRSSAAGGGGGGGGAGKAGDPAKAEKLKIKLLGAVASLDRGLAANVREAQEVDKLAARLELAGGGVSLDWSAPPNGESGMEQLSGTWRLIYSSGFNSGSLGGRRPGPPAAFVPLTLGQVYQEIDLKVSRLDNIVELFASLPSLNLNPFNFAPTPRGAAAATPPPARDPAPGARLTLGHSFEVIAPNTVKIVYEDTSARAIGPPILANLPALAAPQLPDALKPPRDWRSAAFDVTYLDKSMRVTRGDRGELRVYLRDTPLEARVPEDYVD